MGDGMDLDQIASQIGDAADELDTPDNAPKGPTGPQGPTPIGMPSAPALQRPPMDGIAPNNSAPAAGQLGKPQTPISSAGRAQPADPMAGMAKILEPIADAMANIDTTSSTVNKALATVKDELSGEGGPGDKVADAIDVSNATLESMTSAQRRALNEGFFDTVGRGIGAGVRKLGQGIGHAVGQTAGGIGHGLTKGFARQPAAAPATPTAQAPTNIPTPPDQSQAPNQTSAQRRQPGGWEYTDPSQVDALSAQAAKEIRDLNQAAQAVQQGFGSIGAMEPMSPADAAVALPSKPAAAVPANQTKPKAQTPFQPLSPLDVDQAIARHNATTKASRPGPNTGLLTPDQAATAQKTKDYRSALISGQPKPSIAAPSSGQRRAAPAPQAPAPQAPAPQAPAPQAPAPQAPAPQAERPDDSNSLYFDDSSDSLDLNDDFDQGPIQPYTKPPKVEPIPGGPPPRTAASKSGISPAGYLQPSSADDWQAAPGSSGELQTPSQEEMLGMAQPELQTRQAEMDKRNGLNSGVWKNLEDEIAPPIQQECLRLITLAKPVLKYALSEAGFTSANRRAIWEELDSSKLHVALQGINQTLQATQTMGGKATQLQNTLYTLRNSIMSQLARLAGFDASSFAQQAASPQAASPQALPTGGSRQYNYGSYNPAPQAPHVQQGSGSYDPAGGQGAPTPQGAMQVPAGYDPTAPNMLQRPAANPQSAKTQAAIQKLKGAKQPALVPTESRLTSSQRRHTYADGR